jgi:O-antigen/teichoic acid export membrane protein
LILSILAIFTIISDFGLQSLTIKEVSRDKNLASLYLSHNLILKIFLVFCAYLGLYLFASVFYSIRIKSLIMAAGLGFAADSFRNTLNPYFYIYERTDLLSYLNIFGSLLNAALGIFILISGFGLKGIIIQSILVSFILLIFTYFIITKNFVKFEFKIDHAFLRKMAKDAAPFAALAILSIIYFKIDTVLLSIFQGERAVGIYSAPYRLIEVLMFIPTSLVGVLFPFVAFFSVSSPGNLLKSYTYSVKLLLTIILPVAVIIILLGIPVTSLVLGKEFADSAMPLMILGAALVFIFMNAPAGNIIYSSDHLHEFIKWAGFNTLLNILLNLIFIPRYSYNGAAFVTLFTEVTSTLINFHFLRKIFHKTPFFEKKIMKISGAVLTVVLFYLFSPFSFNNVFVYLTLTGLLSFTGIFLLVYYGMIVKLKIFSPEEAHSIRNIFRNIN